MYFEACHVFLQIWKGLPFNEGEISQRLILITKNRKNTRWIIVDFITTLLTEKIPLLMFHLQPRLLQSSQATLEVPLLPRPTSQQRLPQPDIPTGSGEHSRAGEPLVRNYWVCCVRRDYDLKQRITYLLFPTLLSYSHRSDFSLKTIGLEVPREQFLEILWNHANHLCNWLWRRNVSSGHVCRCVCTSAFLALLSELYNILKIYLRVRKKRGCGRERESGSSHPLVHSANASNGWEHNPRSPTWRESNRLSYP